MFYWFLYKNVVGNHYKCLPEALLLKALLMSWNILQWHFKWVPQHVFVEKQEQEPTEGCNCWLHVSIIKELKIHKKNDEVIGPWYVSITKTYLYNFDLLKPHFYVVKLGFTGVYTTFLISAQKIDCGYSLEMPREAVLMSTHNLCFEHYMKKYQHFYLKIFRFWWLNF